MKFLVDMVWLGMEQKDSKKSGNAYFIAKCMDSDSAQIFEFYVPGTKSDLVAQLAQIKVLSSNKFGLQMSAYQGKAQVDLIGVGK